LDSFSIKLRSSGGNIGFMHREGQRLPLSLIAWACLGIGLNVGLARFTYGVMLPALRVDLGLDYLASGSLNTIHLGGYLVGTLAAPMWGHRAGMRGLAVQSHLVAAFGAALCAVAPSTPDLGVAVLGAGRLATGLGAGGGIVAILVTVFAAVSAARRPLVSAITWSGMGGAVIVSAIAVPWLLTPQLGWRSAFAISAVVALSMAVYPAWKSVFFAARDLKSEVTPGRFAVGELVTGRWIFLNLAYLMFGAAYIAFATFAGTRLAAVQAATPTVITTWTLFGFATIAGAAFAVPILGSQFLQAFALIVALSAGTIGALIASAAAAPAITMGAVLVGLGLAATPTIVTSQVRNRCSAEDYPRAFSFASAALGVGQVIGPIAAGALADRFGTAAVPLFAASAYGLAVLFAVADTISVRPQPVV
jgi:MFS family permease